MGFSEDKMENKFIGGEKLKVIGRNACMEIEITIIIIKVGLETGIVTQRPKYSENNGSDTLQKCNKQLPIVHF